MNLKELSQNHVIYFTIGILVVAFSCIFTQNWSPEYDFMSNIIYGYIVEWDCHIENVNGGLYSNGYEREVCLSRLNTKVALAFGLFIFAVGIFFKFKIHKDDKK